MRTRNRTLAWLTGLLLATTIAAHAADDGQQRERGQLWRLVAAQISALGEEIGFDRLSPTVERALHSVPRHAFVPPRQRANAYENRPLPIGYGQTISQPLIVAIMSELLAIEPGDKVFELGTGSGYQAAVLDALGARVFSVEIVEALGRRTRELFDALGHDGIQTRIADGYHGWPEEAPFDAIIVTAAADHIPPPLIRQLKHGGRMVIPVGDRYRTQRLMLVERDTQGRIGTREILAVTFVPLTGDR